MKLLSHEAKIETSEESTVIAVRKPAYSGACAEISIDDCRAVILSENELDWLIAQLEILRKFKNGND